jgi:aryl-alcohol dehydrogenase-like predicted oxidoreductase
VPPSIPGKRLHHQSLGSNTYVTAPIVGASKMSHLEDAIKATEIKLTDEEIAALEELYRPHPVLGRS